MAIQACPPSSPMAPEMVPYTIISRPPGCSTARCSAMTVSPTCGGGGRGGEEGAGGVRCKGESDASDVKGLIFHARLLSTQASTASGILPSSLLSHPPSTCPPPPPPPPLTWKLTSVCSLLGAPPSRPVSAAYLPPVGSSSTCGVRGPYRARHKGASLMQCVVEGKRGVMLA